MIRGIILPGADMLSRRTFLLAAAASAVGVPAALAARYRNVSGLNAGSFVWNPGVTGNGPLTIVVSLAEKILHVYRGTAVVGFSTITVNPSRADLDGVVLTLKGTPGGTSPRAVDGWRAAELLPREQSVPRVLSASSNRPVAWLPEGFAGLLATLDVNGATVVVARERSSLRVIRAVGPFGREIETGSVAKGNVARFAAPELSHAISDVKARQLVSAVVVSRVDKVAYQLHDGEVVQALPVAIEDAEKPLGSHVFALVDRPEARADRGAGRGGDAARTGRWLALGLGADTEARAVVQEPSEASLNRVRFIDRDRTNVLIEAMRPGTPLVLTDDAGPRPGAVARTDIALLATSSPDAPAVADVTPPSRTPPIAVVQDAEETAPRRTTRSRRTQRQAKRKRATKEVEGSPHETWAAKMFRAY